MGVSYHVVGQNTASDRVDVEEIGQQFTLFGIMFEFSDYSVFPKLGLNLSVKQILFGIEESENPNFDIIDPCFKRN